MTLRLTISMRVTIADHMGMGRLVIGGIDHKAQTAQPEDSYYLYFITQLVGYFNCSFR